MAFIYRGEDPTILNEPVERIAAAKRNGLGGWYFITTYYCPVCARTKEYRTRRTDPRPENWKDRHEEVIHACSSHFM